MEAQDIDAFLHENQDFLVVTAAGNEGVDSQGDGNLDYGSITSPGTAKNVLTVGTAGAPNLPPVPDFDQYFSSVEAIAGRPSQGPAAFTIDASGGASWRIKPEIMAPVSEVWPELRMHAPTTCFSADDDQAGIGGHGKTAKGDQGYDTFYPKMGSYLYS